MAETDLSTLSTTADGTTVWGAPMRGAMTTLAVIDGATNVASRRTLGTGGQQSAPGNHTHTSVAITDFDAAVRAVLIQRNAQTGVGYTLVIADAGKLIERNNTAANTLTVPTNAAVPFVVGTTISVVQYGTGITTLTAAAGVTLRSRGNILTLAGQYAMASIYQRVANEWIAAGDLG